MSEATFVTLTKLEVAERQLRQGIRMFFQRVDAVALHTVASAAYGILSDLCGHNGIVREIEDSDILEEMGVKDEVIRAMRSPQNFFKHADRDPNGTVRFSPMLSMCFLVGGVNMFGALTKRTTPEGQALRAWFFLKYPDRMPQEYRHLLDKVRPKPDSEDYGFFLELIDRTS